MWVYTIGKVYSYAKINRNFCMSLYECSSHSIPNAILTYQNQLYFFYTPLYNTPFIKSYIQHIKIINSTNYKIHFTLKPINPIKNYFRTQIHCPPWL